MELISISQSLIKAFYDINSPDYCGIKVYYKFWEQHDSGSTDTFDKGRLFEYLLIGATRDGTRPQMRKHATHGTKLKMEEDIEEMAFWSESKLKGMGFQVVPGSPQLRYDAEYKGIKAHGHYDSYMTFRNREVLADVKFTETAHDDFVNGWGDPENMDLLQAVHYTWLQVIREGKARPFYYLVFGLHKGVKWVKQIKVRVSETTINKHSALIEDTAKKIKHWEPKPTRNYAVCQACPFNVFCPHALQLPNEEIVTI